MLDLIALLEIPAVDIGLFEGRSHLQPSTQFKNPERNGRRLATSVAERGLRVADVFLQTAADFVPLAINHPEKSRRRRARLMFQQTLEFAKASGSGHVSILPGVRFADESAQDSFGRACDELAWRVEQASGHELILGTEGHIGSIVSRPKQIAKLVKSVPGLTLTLDYTHFAYQGMADSEVEPLVPHASHIHVRGASKRRLQAPFDRNVIDYPRLLRRLAKEKYTGYLGIEYVWIDWQHCNEVDNLSETIRWRDFLAAKWQR